jgi:hypothetical protein
MARCLTLVRYIVSLVMPEGMTVMDCTESRFCAFSISM